MGVNDPVRKIKIIKEKDSLAGDFMIAAMNTIKNNSWLMEKIF